MNGDEFPALVARLYARWTLDCLADISYAISNDVISRPQLYQSEDMPDELVDLRMSYGTVARFPNAAQRQAMIVPVLGPSDGSAAGAASNSPFHIVRRKFIDACTAFAQAATDLEKQFLADQVRSSAATLRAHLQSMRGKSLRLTAQQVDSMFDVTARILTSPGISRVFGVDHIDPNWPRSSTDPDGAKLVDAAGSELSLSGSSRLTLTEFLLLQRIALEGEGAIQSILSADLDSEEQLNSLIAKGYTWGTSLRETPRMRQSTPQVATVSARQRQPMPQRVVSGLPAAANG